MKKYIAAFMLASLVVSQVTAESKLKIVSSSGLEILQNSKPNHAVLNKLLNTYVNSAGIVNYKAFMKDKLTLQQYLKSLVNVKVSTLSKDEQLAFWINIYNAATIDQILRNYPVKSIMDISGGKVWDQKLPYTFAGKSYTLNEIEKVKLIEELNDARVHFAVNCAAVSCPKLLNKAYTADNVQSLLNANTSAFLNNTEFNKLSPSKAQLSNIFNWYKADFAKAEGSVAAFINKYAKVKIKENTPLSYINYNWSLNDK
ncbi:DUF547 domain-containing protein [Pedobacter glucosidilyticus]|uniref:DUF547 domain-containing protein n=1 Tax=Pedobacter glucosidilyticus TaxID=1122941 RepID=UPI0004183D8A|nr:DUF547 domain-containing protein [Pedobacter glucosidilyticus]